MRKWKLLLLGALVALSVAATGCLRTSQIFTIYPDGSGKAEIKITLMGMMAMQAQQAAAAGEDPAAQIREQLKGKVYWKDLKSGPGDAGSFVLSGTGYFENIGDLQAEQGGMTFEKTEDGGYKLSLENNEDMSGGMPGMPGGEMDGMPEEQKEQMKQMMKGMLAGFEMKIGFTLPGTVSSIEGFTSHEARSAYFTMDEAAVGKMMDEEEKPPAMMVAISGGDAEGLGGEWDTFKKELEEAKKADADGGSSDDGEEEEEEEEDSEQF